MEKNYYMRVNTEIDTKVTMVNFNSDGMTFEKQIGRYSGEVLLPNDWLIYIDYGHIKING